MKKLVATALLAAGVLAAPGVTDAATPRTVGTTSAFAGPSHFTTSVGGYFGQTNVTMICWTDSNVWAYGTNRWFKVAGLGYNPRTGRPAWITGFVSANRVANQATVGRC